MDKQSNYNHGIIGNGRTCAIIDFDATIVFTCMPDFDSGTVFGGHFGISMVDGEPVKQAYEKNTGILVTTFEGKSGSFEVIDFMPRYSWDGKSRSRGDVSSDIIRVLKPCSGTPSINCRLHPKTLLRQIPN